MKKKRIKVKRKRKEKRLVDIDEFGKNSDDFGLRKSQEEFIKNANKR